MLEFTSDASASVMKTLRELKDSNPHMAEVLLSLDVWHKSKNLRKALNKLAALKANADLKEWITPIVNHFWYCSRTCGENLNVFKVKKLVSVTRGV